jgi:hypothetical protein
MWDEVARARVAFRKPLHSEGEQETQAKSVDGDQRQPPARAQRRRLLVPGRPPHRRASSASEQVDPRLRIDRYSEGSGGGRTEIMTKAEVNRFSGAKLLSGRVGLPPSFSKFTLPVQDRSSICFEPLGARVLLV